MGVGAAFILVTLLPILFPEQLERNAIHKVEGWQQQEHCLQESKCLQQGQ